MIRRRLYRNYQEYLMHQGAKLDKERDKREVLYADRVERFRSKFQVVFRRFPPESSVLCLGARLGDEVEALHVLGFQAKGIDVNPGPGVRQGDMHDIPFPDNEFDVVYTNSLDHARSLEAVAMEVVRVLRPGGVFVVEARSSIPEACITAPGKYESVAWDSIEDLKQALLPLQYSTTVRLAVAGVTNPKPFHIWRVPE